SNILSHIVFLLGYDVIYDIKKCRKTDNFKLPFSYILPPPLTSVNQSGKASSAFQKTTSNKNTVSGFYLQATYS
ncbi:hypothetical protein ACFQ5M_06890, partial [Agrilactobacillus yilanensis]